MEFVDTECRYLSKTGVCDDSNLSAFVHPEGWSCRWDEDDLEEQVCERQNKFSFEQVASEINMQMDLLGRHLDIRAWSSGDRNSVFIYAPSELFKRKLVTCFLWGKPRHHLCFRESHLLVTHHAPCSLLPRQRSEALGDWLHTRWHYLHHLAEQTCLSKAPSFMNAGSWALTSLPHFDGYSWC